MPGEIDLFLLVTYSALTAHSPNNLQWHKVLSGSPNLLHKPPHQSGNVIVLRGEGCLPGKEEGSVDSVRYQYAYGYTLLCVY